MRVLVVHGGALGDSVLVWPLLRALVRAEAHVVFAARPSHARLAAACIDPARITHVDADAPAFARLWSGAASPSNERFDAVITFLADDSTPAGRTWLAAAAAAWPGAELLCVGPPSSSSRAAAWRRAGVAALGRAPARNNPDGPIILHVGAGSPAKRCPLERFITLADALHERASNAVDLIAGEVEAERFAPAEHAEFAAAGGRILPDLEALAAALGSAALVVANDSGPAHLAAQLGVPTLALFGPTDPEIWGPSGPCARVLAPGVPGPIGGLAVDAVLELATDTLALSRFHRSTTDCAIITRLP